MKRIIFLSIVSLLCAVSVMAADKLVVSDITVAQGKEAVLDIGCEMQTACKAFQMDVELGSGFTLKLDAAGKPEAELGTATDHKIYSRRVSDGKYRFVVISMNGQQLPTSGSLLKLTVVAPSTAQAGSSVTCSVKAIEFATAQIKPLVLSNATFKVTIATPPPKGDVNLDNTVDVADIATIIDVMAGGSGIATSLQQVADVNEDGTVDVADIATVIDIMAGGSTEPEPGPEPSYTSCPDDNHPHAIDLGLPSGTQWACCNVGATKPEEYGDYFAWGETQPKEVYSTNTYEYYKNSLTGVEIGSDIAGTGYDAAMANWGSPWHMPTKAQFDELRTYCTSVWTPQNGSKKFTGPNGVTIFLPGAGYRNGSDIYGAGLWGHYWSSTVYESMTANAWFLNIDAGDVRWSNLARYYGISVRPVR